MDYLPLFADLTDRPCLVVGGGAVALRKLRLLRRAGARVTVSAEHLEHELEALAAAGEIAVATEAPGRELIARHVLIIAASDDAELNSRVAALAAAENRLCNVVDDGRRSGFIMPSIIDRAPLVIAISSGGESPVLARWLRQAIEAWLPTDIGALARWAGAKRRSVQKRIGDYTRRLHFWQDVFDGPIADRVLAGDIHAADAAFTRRLDTDEPAMVGEAWLVGAGPGNPDLITRRGLALLQRADSILHDRLSSPALLDYARRDAEIIDVGKRPGGHSVSQDEINHQLIERVASGQRVCRLKGGDPFIFGRGGEEIAALAGAGLPWQVVPGISAAQGCAATSGIPLTHRGIAEAVTFVTGHRAAGHDAADIDWAPLASGRQTLVFFMGVRALPRICSTLIEHGRAGDTPAAIVENGTTEKQRVVGGLLSNIAERAAQESVAAPAVLIVGDVVALAPDLVAAPANAEVA